MAAVAHVLEHSKPSSLVVRQPLPGVTVVRFSGERPLMRAVPEYYGATMHLAGRSQWTSGGEDWSSAPGSLSIKVPGEVAAETAREGALDFQVVLFEAAMIEEARDSLGRSFVLSHMHAMDLRDPRSAPLVALHHQLLDDAPESMLDEAVCEALHALVDVISAPHRAETNKRTKRSAAIARAQAMLDERFTETVGLEELAAHARLDKFRLCRAFREQIGLPPHAYVTYRRVARAQHLLASGMSQAEVAASVGFYDQSLLHRHFKRILRLTPGAFVRAIEVRRMTA